MSKPRGSKKSLITFSCAGHRWMYVWARWSASISSAVVTMGMSFGSVGGAGAGVACHPIYPPRDLFVPDICPPATRKRLVSWRTKHRFAQVTDQSDRQEERLVLAKRHEETKTAQERLHARSCPGDPR